MKNCPNCNAEREDGFELCWNCGYSFTEKKIIEIDNIETDGKGKKINCLRCKTAMLYSGNYKFHEGMPTGFFGAIGELFINRESFDLYLCPKCGKVEFFSSSHNN